MLSNSTLPMGYSRRQWLFSGIVAHHRHTLAVRGPVGVLHVVQHFSRRSPTQRNPRQRPAARIAAVIYGVEPNRQFPALRDRKQFRILQPQFARAPDHPCAPYKADWSPPSHDCAVNDAAVGSEARIPDGTRAKRDLLILGLRRGTTASAQPPPQAKHHQRESHSRRLNRRPVCHAPARLTTGVNSCCGARNSRKMFEIKRNVAGRMKTRLRIFLQAVLHNALQRRRNIAIGLVQLRRIFLQNRAHRIRGRLAVKRALARDHLVENRAQS